jgi:hypothetical protein
LKDISAIAFFVHILYLKRFSNDDRTDMILPTHYCDFNCLVLLLNHTLLREEFFCQNLTFIRLTFKAVYYPFIRLPHCQCKNFDFFWSVLSRAINFDRQGHFKIWLNCHNFKKFPCLIIPTSTKCQKIEKKLTINVIQHDNRL